MMKLPALTETEMACIRAVNAGTGFGHGAELLAKRLGQRLRATPGMARQGVLVSAVVGATDKPPIARLPQTATSRLHHYPLVEVDSALAQAWLDVRYRGGLQTRHSPPQVAEYWRASLLQLIRRALAESVVNQAVLLMWPQFMQLDVRIGPIAGQIRIDWDGQDMRQWAQAWLRAGNN